MFRPFTLHSPVVNTGVLPWRSIQISVIMAVTF